MVKSKLGRSFRLVISLGLLVAVVVAIVQRQAIYDWWRLRDYTPTAEIAQVATNASFTPDARHIFYVYHPELDDRSNFNSHCSSKGEQTIVLGCYVSPIGIYIYDVTDSRLNGVKEVTAAHEMLHAAYDRLSSSEKEHINQLINQAYNNVADERIHQNIDNYRKNGADVTNELHSILGTEVANLPPELEAYYHRYFTNRDQVVADSERYEGVFTSVKDQATAIAQQLKDLKSQIEILEQGLTQQQASLESDRPTIRTQSQADAFNARVRSYNSQVAYVNQLVDRYNSLRDQYNDLAVQQQQLFQALDSRPTATTQ